MVPPMLQAPGIRLRLGDQGKHMVSSLLPVPPTPESPPSVSLLLRKPHLRDSTSGESDLRHQEIMRGRVGKDPRESRSL